MSSTIQDSEENTPVLIVYGTPPVPVSVIEKYWGPLNPFVKEIMPENRAIQISIPSLGAITVATYLKNRGINVCVKDLFTDPIDYTLYRTIGISTAHFDFETVKNLAKEIKSVNNDCTIIIGGPLIWSYSPDKLMNEIEEIDIVINNEGEKAFFEFLCEINIKDGNYRNVKGITFRCESKVCTNQPQPYLEEHDIVIPNWNLLENKIRMPLLPIQTARGCVYNCAFCSEVGFWGKPLRFRSINSVIKEIETNIEKHGISTFRFVDSCFTAPEKRCITLCNEIIERFIKNNINLKWSSYARINTLSAELIDKIKEAGCVALDIGMESGSQTILKNMNKDYTREMIISAVTSLKKIGIFTHCNIVVGFPGETTDTIKETIDTLNQSQPDSYHCMQLFLAQNTDLLKKKEQFQIQGDRLTWEHKTMSSNEAESHIARITKEIRPSTLMIAGEYIAIMLIASGFSLEEIRALFIKISSGSITPQEQKMILLFLNT